MDDLQGWKKVAKTIADISFNEKGLALVEVAGRMICLINTAEGIKACPDRCPHAGSSLCKNGFIDQHLNIVCCTHFYKFSLRTGRDAMNEGYFLKLYPIKVTGEGVFIQIE